MDPLQQDGTGIAGGLVVSRDTLEWLRRMRPAEIKAAVRRLFPGSHLAHMRPRDIEGLVNSAWMREEIGRKRVPGGTRIGELLAGSGHGVALLPLRVLGGGAVGAACAPPARAPRGAHAPPRRRVARRKARAAGRMKLLGLSWPQAAGILFGIAGGIAAVAGALAGIFR